MDKHIRFFEENIHDSEAIRKYVYGIPTEEVYALCKKFNVQCGNTWDTYARSTLYYYLIEQF